MIHRRPKATPAPAPVVSESDSDSEAEEHVTGKKAAAAAPAAPAAVLNFNMPPDEASDSEAEEVGNETVADMPKNFGRKHESDDSDSEAEEEPAPKPKAKPAAEVKATPGAAKPVAAAKSAPAVTDKKKCAVPECPFPRFARGYCSVHIITNVDNELPSGEQRVRNTLNLWYRRDSPTKNKITWKFVHKGHRHEIILVHDAYTNERFVKVDGHRMAAGKQTEHCWYMKFHLDEVNPFPVIIMQKLTDNWRSDLYIDEMSFERGRERFMKDICKTQVAELCMMRGDKDDMSELLKERVSLQQWSREEGKQKTKRGYYKSVVKWKFRIAGKSHTIVLEHGTTGGKRTIKVDDEIVFSKKLGLFDSNTSSVHDTYAASNKHCRICIRDLKKQSARENLVDDDHPQDSFGSFQYDLLIESVPFENCRLSTLDFAEMTDHQLVRADREVALTDKEMIKMIARYGMAESASVGRAEAGGAPSMVDAMKQIGMA